MWYFVDKFEYIYNLSMSEADKEYLRSDEQ